MNPTVGGNARLRVVATDASGPATSATITIEAYMSHPGMAPVVATATSTGAGTYESRVSFPMAGDWHLVVAGALADGRNVRQQLETVVSVAAR